MTNVGEGASYLLPSGLAAASCCRCAAAAPRAWAGLWSSAHRAPPAPPRPLLAIPLARGARMLACTPAPVRRPGPPPRCTAVPPGHRGAGRAVRGVLRLLRLHPRAHLPRRPPALHGRHGRLGARHRLERCGRGREGRDGCALLGGWGGAGRRRSSTVAGSARGAGLGGALGREGCRRCCCRRWGRRWHRRWLHPQRRLQRSGTAFPGCDPTAAAPRRRTKPRWNRSQCAAAGHRPPDSAAMLSMLRAHALGF